MRRPSRRSSTCATPTRSRRRSPTGSPHFGRLDALVNVAGGTFKADFIDTNVRGWDAVIRTNFGWLLLQHAARARQMREQGDGGSIITITSIEGHRAAPGYAVYAGMKAAVTNFSRTLALELAPERIRVNTIAPDQTPTEGMPMEYDARVVEAGIPMGRQGPTRTSAGARCSSRPISPSTSPARAPPGRRRVRVGRLVQLAGPRLREQPARVRVRLRAVQAHRAHFGTRRVT